MADSTALRRAALIACPRKRGHGGFHGLAQGGVDSMPTQAWAWHPSFRNKTNEKMSSQTMVLSPPQTWHVNLPILAGAERLRVVVSDGGGDYNYNRYHWGDRAWAGFERGEKRSARAEK